MRPSPPSWARPASPRSSAAGPASSSRSRSGHDLASAQELNELVTKVFQEEQVYRIDHYLGKETVQNVMALRFANGIFEPLWNRNHVAEVQLTVAEAVGVEGAAATTRNRARCAT